MTPPIATVERAWESSGMAARLRASLMWLIRIDRWDVRRDGPLSEAALQHKLQALGYQVAPRTYSSGSVSPTYTDARERAQAVVHGLIKVSIDGEAAILTSGDVVFVPRGALRRIEVVGANAAHCLEAVYRADEYSPSLS